MCNPVNIVVQMNSKKEILDSLRKHTHEVYDMPDLGLIDGITFADPLAQFCEVLKAVGGDYVILSPQEDINEVIKKKFPEARKIASQITDINIATVNPLHMASPHELQDTDLGIVKGEWGVAENGSVWIPQYDRHRAIYFIPEYLVIILEREKIVNNMHEALECISFSYKGYGVFMSGPSKTADIEQALVMGAHGPRGVLVILT